MKKKLKRKTDEHEKFEIHTESVKRVLDSESDSGTLIGSHIEQCHCH